MIKKLWNSFKIAFSMYSKIPMPASEWTEENISYAFIFFPWVGALIGLFNYGIFTLKEWCACRGTGISELTFVVAMVILPLLITGGIHMDGFLDTQDALSSYQPREKRLEILKDPHAGAFAIISCGVYLMCCLGIYASLTRRSALVVSLGFFLSRTLSGWSVISFPQARKEGLAATFSGSAGKRTVGVVLAFYFALVCLAMVAAGRVTGAAALIGAGLVFFYYRRMAVEKFGGVTGDLAGYFLQMCEIAMAAAAAAAEVVVKYI